MMGRTHISGGLVAGLVAISMHVEKIPALAIVKTPTPIHFAILIAGCLIGALLIDSDTINSKAGRKLIFISYPLLILNKLLNLFRLKYMAKLAGHRGILHSGVPLAIAIVADSFYFGAIPMTLVTLTIQILAFFSVGLLIGMASHLFLDACTTEGIPLFAPFSLKRYSLFHIGTDSSAEVIVHVLLNVCAFVLFFKIMGVDLVSIIGTKLMALV